MGGLCGLIYLSESTNKWRGLCGLIYLSESKHKRGDFVG